MNLSRRILSVEESGTARMFQAVTDLRAAGTEVINLAIGEPAFDPPARVTDATRRALAEGRTRYVETRGIGELRKALADRLGFDDRCILVTNGAKQALFTAFQVLLDPGDEVIVPSPYWVSFTHQIVLAGGVPVLVPTRSHRLDLQAMARAVSSKTKAILINSPNNPTGAVYSREEVQAVLELAEAHDLTVVSDETYAAFVYDALETPSGFEEGMESDRILHIHSFSKQYAMTGFRIGVAAGARVLIDAMTRLQSHLCGNVCTFAQLGAVAALQAEDGTTPVERFREMRDLAYGLSRSLFDTVKPQGAFYLFPDVTTHLRRGESSQDFALRILREAGVAVVPGEEFGAAGHIRISFAVERESLVRGFENIRRIL